MASIKKLAVPNAEGGLRLRLRPTGASAPEGGSLSEPGSAPEGLMPRREALSPSQRLSEPEAEPEAAAESGFIIIPGGGMPRSVSSPAIAGLEFLTG